MGLAGPNTWNFPLSLPRMFNVSTSANQIASHRYQRYLFKHVHRSHSFFTLWYVYKMIILESEDARLSLKCKEFPLTLEKYALNDLMIYMADLNTYMIVIGSFRFLEM